MFSPEYCKILMNTYFEEHLLTAASDFLKQLQNSGEQLLLYWHVLKSDTHPPKKIILFALMIALQK